MVSSPNTGWLGPGSPARRTAGSRRLGFHTATARPGPRVLGKSFPSPADLAVSPEQPQPLCRVCSRNPQLSQMQTGQPLPHPATVGRNHSLASSGQASAGSGLPWGPGGLKKGKWGPWSWGGAWKPPGKRPHSGPWAHTLPGMPRSCRQKNLHAPSCPPPGLPALSSPGRLSLRQIFHLPRESHVNVVSLKGP